MTTYKPGQGLNREALDRLRARKQALNGTLAELPAQDESKQWDRLLGEGAQKKPRCGICTRPLDDDLAQGSLVCLSCGEGSMPATSTCDNGREVDCTAEVCSTASTEDTTDIDAIQTKLVCNVDAEDEMSTLPSDQTQSISKQPAFLKLMQALDGEWVGDEGEAYHVELDEGKCVRRRHGHAQTSHLYYDFHRGKVWWGNYYLEVEHACRGGDCVTWRHCGSHGRDIWLFRWYRPEGWAEVDCACTSVSDVASVAAYESIAARAILEIEEQLFTPGNQGFVWVANWNSRFQRQLGDLRSFLRSRPDKFIVHPGKGKGFRVAAVSKERR